MTQMDRIEEKIDALMEMLGALFDALNDDDDEPQLDLSGLITSRPRDDNQPL